LQVVSAIGAPEGDLLGAFKNVKQIDGEGAIALVKAAEAAGVQHFVMVRRLQRPKARPVTQVAGKPPTHHGLLDAQVSSLGTGKWGWPAGKPRQGL